MWKAGACHGNTGSVKAVTQCLEHFHDVRLRKRLIDQPLADLGYNGVSSHDALSIVK